MTLQISQPYAAPERASVAWIEAVPDPAALIDPDGSIIATNHLWRQSPAGAIHSNINEFLRNVPSLRSFRGEVERILVDQAGRASAEYAVDAIEKSYRLIVTPAPGGALLTMRDITRRKAAEERSDRLADQRLAERERNADLSRLARSLQRSNDELDQYAYVTSHDLKAPLRGIANLSAWIEEDLGPAVITPEAHQQFELLRGRVHRMEALIEGILTYSRVARVKIKPQLVPVGKLLKDLTDLLAPPAGFVIDIQPDMPTLIAECTPLQQVFLNLISNAIKHHHDPAHGHVTITAREEGDCYEFSIVDNGPGIDPAYHHKIWLIFQTLRPRDELEGTGVGLSLVKKIVEDQGGTVRLDSAPGRGSTFSFTWQKDVRTIRPATETPHA